MTQNEHAYALEELSKVSVVRIELYNRANDDSVLEIKRSFSPDKLDRLTIQDIVDEILQYPEPTNELEDSKDIIQATINNEKKSSSLCYSVNGYILLSPAHAPTNHQKVLGTFEKTMNDKRLLVQDESADGKKMLYARIRVGNLRDFGVGVVPPKKYGY